MRRKYNMLFSLILCILLVFSDTQFIYAQGDAGVDTENVSAENPESEESVSGDDVGLPCPTPYAVVNTADRSEVKTAIYNALAAFKTEIDISSYKIPEDNIAAIYANVVNSSPELFYVTGAFSYSFDYQNMVLVLEPEYSPYYNAGSRDVFEARLGEILNSISSGATDLEKLLILHDYIVTHCEYDHSQSKQGIYDAYGCLVNGLAVCQGYSEAYHVLLKKLGIPCKTVYSRDLAHTWNLISLNGKWYYVDVTYDDPETTDTFYCGHQNFLRSREGMKETGHKSDDWKITEDDSDAYKNYAGSTDYDSFFWSDCIRPVPVAKGAALYFSAGKLNIHDFSKGSVRQYKPEGGALTAITSYSGLFYYSTHSGIYSLSADGRMSKCYSLNATESSYGGIYELTPESRGVRYHIMKAAYTAVLYSAVYVADGGPAPTGGDDPQPTLPSKKRSIKVVLKPGEHIFSGEAQKLSASELRVFDSKSGDAELIQDVDYTVTYPDDIVNAGVKKIKITGIGAYSGSVKKSYKIMPKKSGNISIGAPAAVQFAEGGVNPAISVVIDGRDLENGKDCRIKYSSNKKAGNGKYTISFIGNYKGFTKKTGYFRIDPAILSPEQDTCMIIPDMAYTKAGRYFSKPIVVKDDRIVPASQLNVSYYLNDEKMSGREKFDDSFFGDKDRIEIKAVIEAAGNYTGTLTGTYTVRKADKDHDISRAGVSIVDRISGKKKTSYVYTGEAVIVDGDDEIVVTAGKDKIKLVKDKDYVVQYAANVHKGKAYVIIRGIGEYAGSKKISFKIVKG